MTPEQWTAILAGLGAVLSAIGIRSIVIKAMELWVRWSGDGRTLAEQRTEREAQLDLDERKWLRERIGALETAATISDAHHDSEIADIRQQLTSVQRELSDTKVAAAISEAERQTAMRLYTELLQAHAYLKQTYDALQLQVTALTAENATLRRQLPAAPS